MQARAATFHAAAAPAMLLRWLSRAYLGLVFGFLYLPIAVLVVYSFNKSRNAYRWGGFGLDWYRALWANEALLEAAGHSLALATATLTTLAGALIAVALHRWRIRGRAALKGALFAVMMTPDIVCAISLLALFAFLGVKLGFVTLLLAHATFCLPFVVVTVSARLAGFDLRLGEAARDLGASEWQVVRTVYMPLLLPALTAGWLLGFTLSLDDTVVSMFVTGPAFDVLPLRVYGLARIGLKPEINALGTAMLVLSLALLGASHLIARRSLR